MAATCGTQDILGGRAKNSYVIRKIWGSKYYFMINTEKSAPDLELATGNPDVLYNFNYTPTILGVQSRTAITSAGTRTKKG
jgi:hypothetical protein